MAKNKVRKPIKAAPITNPELRKAIDALKEGSSAEKQSALTAALKKAKLLSPCAIDADLKPNAQGKIANIRPNQIRVFLINTKDGKVFFPAFTDIGEAGKFKVTGENDPQPQNVVRSIADFDKMLSDPSNKAEGIVINPGSDNVVIPKQLAAVAAGRIKMPTQNRPIPSNAPLNVVYSEPSVYPTRMINAVYDRCAELESVERVWLKQKMAGGQISFFLVVEDSKKNKQVLNDIQEAAVPLAKDIAVEVVFADDKIMKEVIKDAVALYDKELEL